MSPKTVIATVRGIGVAVITSVCGVAPSTLARRASRCSTPKRCCSSTTTRPSSANCTCSWIRAWVPTTMPASPEAARSRLLRRSAADWLPVSSASRLPSLAPPSMPASASGPSIALIDRWSWTASTSVGANSAAWPPPSMTLSIASNATTVLPEPTSPCSSRCIGRVRPRSCVISSSTCCWPGVSSKGRRCRNWAARPPGTAARGTAGIASEECRITARAVCRTNASWYFIRQRALRASWGLRGWCTIRRA